MAQNTHDLGQSLERLSGRVTRWTGSTAAFITAIGIVITWALVGPVFGYSNTWQLVINTGTTIVTFLMVFLIQRSQNKDALVMHLKLNELVAAKRGASNRLIDVEALSEEDLKVLSQYYHELAELAGRDSDVSKSHSIEEARNRHSQKLDFRRTHGAIKRKHDAKGQ
jgi:low affinity Fe/Cu permease